MENLELKANLLHRINSTGVGGISMNSLSQEFQIDFFIIQGLSNEFLELQLVRTINAGTKTNPNDKILIIEPKGRFTLKDEKELQRLFHKKGNNKNVIPSQKEAFQLLKWIIPVLISLGILIINLLKLK